MKKIHIFSVLAAGVIILPVSMGVSAQEEKDPVLTAEETAVVENQNTAITTNDVNEKTEITQKDLTNFSDEIQGSQTEDSLKDETNFTDKTNVLTTEAITKNDTPTIPEIDSEEISDKTAENTQTNNLTSLDGTTPGQDVNEDQTEDPANKVEFTVDFSGLPSQMEVGKKTSGTIVVSADKSLNLSFQESIYLQVDSGHMLFTLDSVKETADNKTLTYYISLEPTSLGVSKLDVWDYYNHKDGILLASKEIEGVKQVPIDPTPDETIKFEDVDPNSWYAPYVEQAAKLGLMTGTDSTHFSPYANMSRGMVATVLYRMDGAPNVSSENIFKDVPNNLWFSKPISWAKENRIISGYTGEKAGYFGPSDPITREQLAVMLMNFSTFKGINTSIRTGIEKFPDAKSVSSYAANAVDWMVSLGIITGVTVDGTQYIKPSQYASRAECAKMILMINKLCNDKDTFNSNMQKTQDYLTAYNEGSLAYFKYLASDKQDTDASQAAAILMDGQLQNYTHFGDSKDATSLDNMEKALSYLKECNEIRIKEKLEALKVSSKLMAIAQKQVNYAAAEEKHAPNHYNIGENLSWQKEPYIGWYYDVKEIIGNGGTSNNIGNYKNVVNPDYTVTGFGVTENTKYGICNAQVFDFYGSGTDLDTYIQNFNSYKRDLQNNINKSLEALKITL